MSFNKQRYDTMQFNRCGNSGLKLPAISMGCWNNFGVRAEPGNMKALLRRCFDLGITHFDLANNYGPPPGSAEENVGRVLASEFGSHRDELIISTKAGYLMWPGPYGDWGSRKYILASLDQSLKRLGLDYVDIFYHHRRDPETPLEESMGALDSAVRQGKAIYAGISNYNGEDSKKVMEIARRLNLPLVINQSAYSMIRRNIEGSLVPYAREIGMGIIAFCPLAQGLLTDKYLKGIPADSRAANPDGTLQAAGVNESTISKVGKLNELAQARGQSLAQMALMWVLRDAGVTSALIGASKVRQLEENVAALENRAFSEDEFSAIDRILAG
ncbi:MAG: aldo/keto reductase [Planctomycetota bacterium]|nr:aldo/keto reductase [Planctomycetota bacterium]